MRLLSRANVLKDVPVPLVEALKLQEVTIVESFASNEKILKDKIADAIISVENGQILIEMIEPDSIKTTTVSKALSEALKQMNPNAMTVKMDLIGFCGLGFRGCDFCFCQQ